MGYLFDDTMSNRQQYIRMKITHRNYGDYVGQLVIIQWKYNDVLIEVTRICAGKLVWHLFDYSVCNQRQYVTIIIGDINYGDYAYETTNMRMALR